MLNSIYEFWIHASSISFKSFKLWHIYVLHVIILNMEVVIYIYKVANAYKYKSEVLL